ncbi:MAG: hypothetical protein IPG72_08110 [Ardenticatenales bacterium]|jgi:hypothetical protein|nr:hypothetical protein [Ardenticatenales bacterium]
MRDVFEFAIPATFMTLFFALVFAFLGWLRWMRFRETIALADRGFAPADAPNGTNRMLRWSLILLALGLALSCGLAPIAIDNLRAFPALIPGLTLLFLGLAFLLYWLVTGGRDHLMKANATAAVRPIVPPPPAPPAPSWSAADSPTAAGSDDDLDPLHGDLAAPIEDE